MDLYIYAVPLPAKVKGVLVQKEEAIIFVNDYLTEEEQRKAIAHELSHYKFDHVYDMRSVGRVEQEAI